MARLLRVTAREVARKLERDGWFLARQTGGHAHYHPIKRGTVTVPMHRNQILIPPVLRSILRQAGLTSDEIESL